jgi:hypothetical protein
MICEFSSTFVTCGVLHRGGGKAILPFSTPHSSSRAKVTHHISRWHINLLLWQQHLWHRLLLDYAFYQISCVEERSCVYMCAPWHMACDMGQDEVTLFQRGVQSGLSAPRAMKKCKKSLASCGCSCCTSRALN